MTFRNNIFVSGEGQIEGGSEKGRFEGNIYRAMGDGGFSVDGFNRFEAWVEATGQEKIGPTVVGRFLDPMLRKTGTGLITDPSQLSFLEGCRLMIASPAIDTGLGLRSLFRIDPGRCDFYGRPVPRGKGFDVGAHEFSAEDTVPAVSDPSVRR